MKTCVLITGMHRSGTSMVAGLVNAMGAYVGNVLGPHKQSNAKGFFEHKKIMRLNDNFLKTLGSGWASADDLKYNEAQVKKFKASAKEIITKDFSEQDIFAIKDPRICKLISIWVEILDELKINTRVILCVRHPYNVHMSLRKRKKAMGKGPSLSYKQTTNVWLSYYKSFFDGINKPHITLYYDEVIEDPNLVAERIIKFVGKGLCINDKSNDFISSGLRHNSYDKNIDNEEANVLYKSLREQARNQ